MKPTTFLSLFEKLLRHLPDALQALILREITPIKNLSDGTWQAFGEKSRGTLQFAGGPAA